MSRTLPVLVLALLLAGRAAASTGGPGSSPAAARGRTIELVRQAAPPPPGKTLDPGTGTGLPASLVRRPPAVHPRLTAGRYVFPVYGQVDYTDTFGAPRADVAYHHGDDIFAPLGTPVLAVADGRVYSVGWNEVGGNRIWLQDGQGNQFYYAHLSAFSPAARDGRAVRAGTVLGFVGNTGDAAGTPYHLHFEVHPVSLLYLGYDGAVDPTPYLVGWQRLHDVSFTAAPGWAPPAGSASPAPRPGAVLLGASDISGANGLDPGSLRRALAAPVPAEGDGGLVRAAPIRGG